MNKETIKNSFVYEWYDTIRTAIRTTYYRLLPVKKVISKQYKRKLGREMNWGHPVDLNEKINWLKLNSDTTKWTELSDKYLVREYVKEKGFEDILVPLYGKWDKAEDIEFHCLPDSFVMKTNHGSGDVVIVKNKSSINEKSIKKSFKKALWQRFGYVEGEPHYLGINPCIIAEKYLEQNHDNWTSSIVDYKIWCFDGKPECIRVYYNRTKTSVNVETRDLNWGYHPETQIFTNHFKDGHGIVPKPKCLNRMLQIASILSEGFPQVRVDLYVINDHPYFGELTFTSNGGYMNNLTQDYLTRLGSLVNIEHLKTNR